MDSGNYPRIIMDLRPLFSVKSLRCLHGLASVTAHLKHHTIRFEPSLNSLIMEPRRSCQNLDQRFDKKVGFISSSQQYLRGNKANFFASTRGGGDKLLYKSLKKSFLNIPNESKNCAFLKGIPYCTGRNVTVSLIFFSKKCSETNCTQMEGSCKNLPRLKKYINGFFI